MIYTVPRGNRLSQCSRCHHDMDDEGVFDPLGSLCSMCLSGEGIRERAAIIEFDGHEPRSDAIKLAVELMKESENES